MADPASAPTARVLDVLELLSQPGTGPLRFTDVAGTLGISQGTANAILSTLAARGWVDRDPRDKRYSIGPALSLLALRVQAGRTVALAATAAARELAEETGMLVNLAERVGDEVAVLTYEGGDPEGLRGSTGESIPYAPPFGITFAAWEDPAGRRAWIDSATADPEVAAALERLLTDTRERGYSIEWMTEVMAEVAELLPALSISRGGVLPKVLRRVMDALLVEYVGPGSQHFRKRPDPSTPVIVISAPVVDERGRVLFTLNLHPLRPLTAAEISRLGQRVVEVGRSLGPVS